MITDFQRQYSLGIKLSAIWVVGRHRAAVCRRLRGRHRPGSRLSTRGGGPLLRGPALRDVDAVGERLLSLMSVGTHKGLPHDACRGKYLPQSAHKGLPLQKPAASNTTPCQPTRGCPYDACRGKYLLQLAHEGMPLPAAGDLSPMVQDVCLCGCPRPSVSGKYRALAAENRHRIRNHVCFAITRRTGALPGFDTTALPGR